MIAQALVDAPEHVSVQEVRGDRTTVFELRAAKSDLGKIIGRKGRTAEAIRIIVCAVSAKEKKRAVIEIVDSNNTIAPIHHFQNPGPVESKKAHGPDLKSA